MAGLLAGTFVIVWVLFAARGTSAGPAISDPARFASTVLNGLTIAALYFVVASGFTLVFGLMRVVNLAHGSFFLLGGYLALEVQRFMVGKRTGVSSADVDILRWVVPLLVAVVVVGVIGLLIQQVFLRWFQGQMMRETLITIAISVIFADQMLAHFGGIAKALSWPAVLDQFPIILGVRYALSRLFMLGVALVVGGALWVWLQRTRAGMVIRAGVDDTAMVEALGINVQRFFALAFLVGAGLAALGGVMGGSFASLAPGVDGLWLLNSIIVVIIGGMGSMTGAAAGSLLLGMVTAFSPAYLPIGLSQYSIIFTFILLAAVLAFRPYGLFGRPA